MRHYRTIQRVFLMLATLGVALLTVAAAPQDGGSDASLLPLERAIFRAFDDSEYDRAAELIEDWLERRPADAQMLYNLACARSRLGERQEATVALLAAVKAGFRNFRHLETDPDLEAIREEATYLAIVEAAHRVDDDHHADGGGEDALARWKREFGDEDYRYDVDEARGLAFATALDEVSHAEMRAMLQHEADHLVATLFDAGPGYVVLIAVPTPADALAVLDPDPAIGGRYDHGMRRLVARDIGGSLRHEFVHAMHYGHMERLGLATPHPLWVQEGLAALYEDYEVEDDASIRFVPNERNNIVVNRARAGRLTSWSAFFAMNADQFMARPRVNYPQARAIFEYVAEKNKLSAWYRAFVKSFAEDPTGATAFEVVFERPIGDIEQDWRRWVRRRPLVDRTVEHGDASIGIITAVHSSNDGILIDEVLPNSAARRARLRRGDVIVSIDGQSTRSLLELRAAIGDKAVGDTVTLRVRRDGQYFAVELVLRPLRLSR